MNSRIFLIGASALLYCSSILAATPEQIRMALRQSNNPDQLVTQFVQAGASAAAKQAPMLIDANSELTGAAAIGKTLIYYVRLVNHKRSDIVDLQEFRRQVSTKNAPSVCSAPISSILIGEYDAEYKYMVYSKDKEYIFEYSFNKITCGQLASK